MNLHVTVHAIERAMQRIPGIRSEDEARAILSSETIHQAVEFGAIAVTLGTGQRIVINDGAIITVLSKERRRIHAHRRRHRNHHEGEAS